MHHFQEIIEGLALGSGLCLVTIAREAYPLVAFFAALCALIIGMHGVFRLYWRWRHGYSNLLSDKELAE